MRSAEIAAERLALLGVQPVFALDLADRIPGAAFPIVRTEFARHGKLVGRVVRLTRRRFRGNSAAVLEWPPADEAGMV